jgi:hypothetical protein
MESAAARRTRRPAEIEITSKTRAVTSNWSGSLKLGTPRASS